jgi:hypothetical protein
MQVADNLSSYFLSLSLSSCPEHPPPPISTFPSSHSQKRGRNQKYGGGVAIFRTCKRMGRKERLWEGWILVRIDDREKE